MGCGRSLVLILVLSSALVARADDVAPPEPRRTFASLAAERRGDAPPTSSPDVSSWPPQPPAPLIPAAPGTTPTLTGPTLYGPASSAIVPPTARGTLLTAQAPPSTTISTTTTEVWQPAPPAAVMTPAPVLPMMPRLVESTWYTRVEYMHWSESFQGANFVTENGPLFTVGYQRRIGSERFRGEIFGSQVHYSSQVTFDDGTTAPLSSQTDYLGARLEYDYTFDPDWPPPIVFFGGVGTRFWIRNLPDMTTDAGDFVQGYQETWWTIYPYIGVESRRDESKDVEFYGRGRIGLVAITYEHLTLHETTLFPGPGVTSQLELGFRGEYLFLAGYAEVFTWQQSSQARGLVQPSSVLFTVGLKTGLSF